MPQRGSSLATRLVLGLILWTASASAAVDRLPTFYGPVVGRGWNDDDAHSPGSARAAAAFAELARAGASAVAVDVVALVAQGDSPFLDTPRLPREVELERLAWTVARARAHGLRPVLRARIDRLDGGPRAAIAMVHDTGWNRFFDELRTWCADWAREAERLGFDLFVLPSDLGGTTHRESDWRRVVAAVRARYRGPITYGADPTDEVRRIGFWDEFDAIGVATFPGVDRPGDRDPSPRPKPSVWSAADEDSVAALEIARELGPVLDGVGIVARDFDRPVIVTGAAIRSVEQAWQITDGPIDRFATPDERAQARAAAGVLRGLRDRPWLRGVLWREVDLDGDDADALRRRARSVSVNGKRAFDVLADFWRRPTVDGGGRRVVGAGGMVATDDSLAARVGTEILRTGGNAVDAAVAMAFVLGVTRPDAVGLGGGGTAVVHDPQRGSRVVDFRARAPLTTHEHFFTDLAAEGVAGPSLRGPIAAAVPGFTSGLHAMWSRGGTRDWAELLRPALRAAADGFRLPTATATALDRHRTRLRGEATTRDVFLPDGRRLNAGDLVLRPRLAETLLAIRREGPAALRHGPRARRLVEGVQRAGGVWTLGDLESAVPPRSARAARWPLTRNGRVELRVRRDVRPSGFDPRAGWQRVEDLPEGIELGAVARVWAESLDVTSDWTPADAVEAVGGTGFAVIDADGHAVVAHFDLGRPFGCGWTDPDSGILLNASMVRFDAGPHAPGARPGPTRVRPGAAAPSIASPALVIRDGRVQTALVAAGGGDADVLQVLRHHVLAGWPLERAVAAPRVMPGPTFEAHRVPVGLRPEASSRTAPVVIALERRDDGTFAGAIDPRGTTVVLPVESIRIRSSRSAGRSW